MIEHAFAVLGFILVYMNGPRWLRPRVRPFTCGYCMCWWASWVLWALAPSWDLVTQAGITMALAAVAGYQMPVLMFESVEPGPDVEDRGHTAEFGRPELFVDRPVVTDDRQLVP